MKLTEVKNDECVFIAQIEGSGSFRARLGEMGFVKGQQIKRLFASPVGNPIVFEIMGSKVALRSQEAASIDVVYHAEEIPDSEGISSSINSFSRIRFSTQSRRLSAREKCLSGL